MEGSNNGLGSVLSKSPLAAEEKIPDKRHRRRKRRERVNCEMEVMTTTAEVHRSPPASVHTAARRNRSRSRHDKHKCHKSKQRTEDSELLNLVYQLKTENYLLNRRLNASLSSIDSGYPNECLPPTDNELKNVQQLRQEQERLAQEVNTCRVECEKAKTALEMELNEKACLKDDVAMLKNLVYRLNVELEKCQLAPENKSKEESRKRVYDLPEYYNKNFLKPVFPLLRAYSETIQEKNEVIESLEKNFVKFNENFHELLKENETLYKELEVKKASAEEGPVADVNLLLSELKMTKAESELFRDHANLEAEKIEEIKTVYQAKVSLLERERDVALDRLEEVRAELHTLQGQSSVLKHELERLRLDEQMKVPMAVHSASVAECKRLFQHFKNEHDAEKQDLLHKLSDSKSQLLRRDNEIKKIDQERLSLEQSNFDLAFECDDLRLKLSQLEKKMVENSDGDHVDKEADEIKSRLTEALKKNNELSYSLKKTRKRLQHSMAFAEDLVKNQESLLAKLHEENRENSALTSQFGTLKEKIKSVEKGANANLEEVESTIMRLKAENDELVAEVERLNTLLRHREDLQTEDTSS